jgi:hypothetical protein
LSSSFGCCGSSSLPHHHRHLPQPRSQCWGKALWLIFAIVLPFLGVLIYLLARGGSMAQRDVRQAQEADAATRRHIQSAAGTSTSTA